jgi:3-methyladenine DNA glycosylase AlkD
MTTASRIKKRLAQEADASRAAILQRFFKTGKGQYGEGDKFLGITVPVVRGIVNDAGEMAFSEISKLLSSKFHEERMAGVFSLVAKTSKQGIVARKEIAEFYLKNSSQINNWDLVDLSAPQVLGEYLLLAPARAKDKTLSKLSDSKILWERRIAMLATLAFIREREYGDTLALAKKYLSDKEDLMHKATGWLLREIGKRDRWVLEEFLERYAAIMPRTMLRYAIEKFAPAERKYYMNKERRLTNKPNDGILINRDAF